mgnify:CR=1 FL=1
METGRETGKCREARGDHVEQHSRQHGGSGEPVYDGGEMAIAIVAPGGPAGPGIEEGSRGFRGFDRDFVLE